MGRLTSRGGNVSYILAFLLSAVKDDGVVVVVDMDSCCGGGSGVVHCANIQLSLWLFCYTHDCVCRRCASIAQQSGLPLIGNGDVFSPTEWATRLQTGVTTAMIGRAALIKPWLFTGVKVDSCI